MSPQSHLFRRESHRVGCDREDRINTLVDRDDIGVEVTLPRTRRHKAMKRRRQVDSRRVIVPG